MSGWRTIETAPRNGTPIDLWARSCFWNADGEKQVAVEMRVTDAIWFDDRWTNTDGNPHEALEGLTAVEFTHWRPLPPTPSATGGEGVET